MEETIINSIKNLIATTAGLSFVDEDRGQLDAYSMSFPVKWPCALIDVSDIDYTEIGVNRAATPRNRQMGSYQVTIKVANLKVTKSSVRASADQKSAFNAIHTVIEIMHAKVQGFVPAQKCGQLIRLKKSRVKRDDGVQQYEVIYEGQMTDV